MYNLKHSTTVLFFLGIFSFCAYSPLFANASLPERMQTLDNKLKLDVGDKISFQVVEDREEAKSLVVVDSGEVNVPYIGRVLAQGKTCQLLAIEIKKKLDKEYYYNSTVIVALDELRKFKGKLYISGGVLRKGPMDIPADEVFTLSKAILRAGGFTPDADRSKVRIERKRGIQSDKKTIAVDMTLVLDQGRTDLDPTLQPDDLIIVPKLGQLGRIYLSGEIVQAGPQDIPPNEEYTVSKAIQAAGGFKQFADKRKVKLIRKTGPGDSDKEEIIVDVKAILREGKIEKDIPVKNGDRIIVRERLFNF